MTLLAPVWLMLAGAAALAVAALHFIATHRLERTPLPTARFIAANDVHAVARAARPADPWLLVVRVLALLALGAAFGGLRFVSGGETVRRVLVADRSRAATVTVRDSALAYWRPGDGLVLADSVALGVMAGARDSLDGLSSVAARGELSAGVAAAWQSAALVAPGADAVELVIVSPFAADEFDAATSSLISAWPGRVRVVRPSIARPHPQAVALRARVSAADSALARAGSAVVVWPSLARGAPGVPVATATAPHRPRGVTTRDAVLVAPLGAAPITDHGVVVARWDDGAPAAVERVVGEGCVRSVGIDVPTAGDVTLRPAFVALAHTLLGPCAARATGPAAADSLVRALQRDGPAAAASRFRDPDSVPPLTPWLLAAAMLLLAGEMAMRRDGGKTS